MQDGQVFELKSTRPGGQRLWAYRYGLDGRGSRRIQRGGYASADDARAALQQALTAAQRRKGRVRVTLADLAEEYLGQHDGQPETTGKLRWLLTKSTAAFGSTPLTELDARDRRLADDTPDRTPIRSHPSPPADPRPCRRVGPARHQPCQDRRRQPATAAPRDAPVRHRRPARGARRRARTRVRTHSPVRRRHRPAPRRMDRARAPRHRPQPPARPRPPSLPRQPPQAHQDQHRPRRAAPAIRARRARPAPVATQRDVTALPRPGGRLPRLAQLAAPPLAPRAARRRHHPDPPPHDLRHTFATVARRAGLGTYELSCYMGTSLINIERTYGHLAGDSHQHALQLLDDYNSGRRDVDAGGRSVDVGTPFTPLVTTAKTA